MTVITTPRGYTLVLPPGWTRVPLRAGTEAAIAEIVERTFVGQAQDALGPERMALRANLRQLTSTAAVNGGLDLYLPTELMHGFTVAASFVAAELSFGSMDNPDPGLVLARLVAKGGATRTVLLAGVTAARSDTVAPPDPARDIPFGSRRVDYVLPVPKDADRWLVVTFSTIGQGDPQDDFAALLVELFDAIMTTFRWTT
jgi:hypothetical protein